MVNLQKLTSFLENKKEKKYRLEQIKIAFFKDLTNNWSEISTLSKSLQTALTTKFPNFNCLKIKEVQTSSNGQVIKIAFETLDNEIIEAVLMRHLTGRNTLCISSQIGCPLGCQFCSTGTLGFKRNLQTEEIVEQLILFKQYLIEKFGETDSEAKPLIRNVVFMGMGEPLLNYDNVIEAIQIFNNQKYFGIGNRHLTISSAGIIPKIKQLADDNINVKLAISLHASNNQVRNRIMPINQKYPLVKLLEALEYFYEKTNKRVFYEYVLLKDINDKPNHATELISLFKGKNIHLNLLSYNASPLIKNLKKVGKEGTFRFLNILKEAGIPVSYRTPLGDDIDGACGQLAGKIKQAKNN